MRGTRGPATKGQGEEAGGVSCKLHCSQLFTCNWTDTNLLHFVLYVLRVFVLVSEIIQHGVPTLSFLRPHFQQKCVQGCWMTADGLVWDISSFDLKCLLKNDIFWDMFWYCGILPRTWKVALGHSLYPLSRHQHYIRSFVSYYYGQGGYFIFSEQVSAAIWVPDNNESVTHLWGCEYHFNTGKAAVLP